MALNAAGLTLAANADQRILVRLVALGMIGRGLIDLGRRLNR